MFDLTKQSELKELASKIDALRKRRDDMLRSNNWIQGNQDEYILELDAQWPAISSFISALSDHGVQESAGVEGVGGASTADMEAIAAAYEAGAIAVHNHWCNSGESVPPWRADFSEAARDYARSLLSGANTKSDGGVESRHAFDREAGTRDRCNMDPAKAGVAPGPSDSLLSKTLTEGEQKRPLKDRNTRPASAGVREVLRNLVSKLHKVHQHPQYKAVWTLHQIYNGQYTGPNYEEEFKAANLALSDHGVQKSAVGANTKSDGGVEGHAQRATSAATAPRLAASGMGGIEAPAAGIKPGPSDSLLSKTLSEVEKKRPQIEPSRADEGSSLSRDGVRHHD